MKGYLIVKPVAGIERELRTALRQNYDKSELSAIATSLESRGWIPLTATIKEGNFLKVSAEKQGTRYEARFNLGVKIPQGEHGTCEIRGGPFACVGKFVSVQNLRPEPHPFKVLFVCESSSGDGKSILKWWIGVNEYVDADKIAAED